MQRLFSTFPNGWPGCGLLLLRVTCAAPVLVMETAELSGTPAGPVLWLRLFGCLAAFCIVAGFWTPFAASCLAIMQGVMAFSAETFWSTHLILTSTAASLVMLGPGAWSIDARLYGRKRIDLQR
jgi:putative oxidoreductase